VHARTTQSGACLKTPGPPSPSIDAVAAGPHPEAQWRLRTIAGPTAIRVRPTAERNRLQLLDLAARFRVVRHLDRDDLIRG
jgi:hypothetical protein